MASTRGTRSRSPGPPDQAFRPAMRPNPGNRQAAPDPDGAIPESGQFQEVVAECTEAIRLDPEMPPATVDP